MTTPADPQRPTPPAAAAPPKPARIPTPAELFARRPAPEPHEDEELATGTG